MEETGLKEGDMIEVKLLDIDPKNGKLKLSHKALLPKPEKERQKQVVTEDGKVALERRNRLETNILKVAIV